MDQEIVRQIVARIIRRMAAYSITSVNPNPIPIRVANRHAPLSQEDVWTRHIQMRPFDAELYGVADGQSVQVKAGGEQGVIFNHVVVRVNSESPLEFHISMDEANSAGVRQGDRSAYLITEHNLADSGLVPVSNDKNAGIVSEEVPEKLVTEEIVRQARKRNARLIINKGVICTPLAKDAIRELGVNVIWK